MSEAVKEIKILVEHKLVNGISGNNCFKTLQELKIWLDRHPELAKELGYIVKKG